MTTEERQSLAQQLAEHWAEQMDMGDLMQYFIDGQIDYIYNMTSSEFEEALLEAGLIAEGEETL
jgi:predicted regulator of Ras-like GTPase activity (Roadblock/LC7/MglB family)